MSVEPTVTVDARFLAWPVIRSHAQQNACRWKEKRIGLLSKQFSITGTEEQLRGFVLGMSQEAGVIGEAVLEAIRENKRRYG